MNLGSFNEEATAVWDFVRCQRPNGTFYGTAGKCRKGTEVGEKGKYSDWKPLAEGNYGKVSISPDGTRVVKELLTGKDGKKGEFGTYEVELATKMGELGHSPRIFSHSEDHIEMETAKGKTLWKTYAREEGEPRMNAKQATQAAAAILDLHRMGFAHGDMHALQWLADGDNLKLVDFGLSVPTSRQPVRVMQDLSKIAGLVNWGNPELADNPYVQTVNKYLERYKEVKGTSQKAKNEREKIALEYLAEINSSSYSEWNFTRCERKDGSAYGTAGKCRKGVEAEAKEGTRPYKVAVTQGRFNIPHLGHVRLIQEMLEQADTAHVVIGRGADNVETDLRSQFLRAALRHAGVDLSRVKLIKGELIQGVASKLKEEHGGDNTVLVLGEDQGEFMNKLTGTAGIKGHLVPRSGESQSSTKIRQMVDADDEEALSKVYEGDRYLVRLARAARSVEQKPAEWGIAVKEKKKKGKTKQEGA